MGVRYDEKYVKRPNIEHEYTEEQIVELQECYKDLFYFIKYVKIVNPDSGEVLFEPRGYQEKLLNNFQKYRFNIALCSRQSGKTTAVAVYALWLAMFKPDKVVGIVSNKESSAKMVLSRIRRMYKTLPVWLKPGVEEFSKMFVSFDNGSRIIISATSEDAFRGEAINLLICDEFAFVPKNQAESFWSSNYPTISASTESKIVIISTPNGMFNLFHRLYSGAERGENSFKPIRVSWDEVPGRDEEWAKEQRANLGKQQFMQEYAVEFLGSTNTVIDSDILEKIIGEWKDPIHVDLNNRFFVYEKPRKDAQYVIGADTAKGTGEHFSVAQILKIISVKPVKLEQVGVFIDNNTDVYTFADIINRLSYYYNNAYIMVENNAEGSAVVHRLWWELENGNLVNTGSKNANLGIRAMRNTKNKAVLLMKKLIEDGSLKIYDKETLEELTSFVEEGNKFFGKDKPDDAVSALYWACYLIEMNILEESYSFDNKEDNSDAWGLLSDVDVKIEDDWSWLTETSLRD